jgi:Pyruvate/2-oxoacid:ferredoxin oxidoreductase gamma subunit
MEKARCIFVGVGGQGNLLASNLLGLSALSLGIPVVVSEIHGMAQRGGVVESAVLLGGISSPIVSDGEADVLVSFEPLETMRILNKCNKETVVITNSQPLFPFTVSTGKGGPCDLVAGKRSRRKCGEPSLPEYGHAWGPYRHQHRPGDRRCDEGYDLQQYQKGVSGIQPKGL